MKWNLFILSALLAGYLLLSLGAPPLPIGLGILGGYLWHRTRPKSPVSSSQNK